MHTVLGFRVEITGAGSGTDVDSAWEQATGGSLNIEIAESSVGTDQFHTSTPGHKYVDSLTLKGPLTSGRKLLCQWITEVVQGKTPWQRQLVITEITTDGSDGKSYTYEDCFPTRYVFPSLSASGTGNLYETVTIKPIRLGLA
jgi:hypothetical protein